LLINIAMSSGALVVRLFSSLIPFELLYPHWAARIAAIPAFVLDLTPKVLLGVNPVSRSS